MFDLYANERCVPNMKQVDQQTRLAGGQVASGWLGSAYN
jgi:hypothetical protein